MFAKRITSLMNIKPDKSWTLFLDRDGVINYRPPGDYIKKWEAFRFLPGVLEALAIFGQVFKRIIVVTNQQGIGKGLMSFEDLEDIHSKMMASVENAGGRIDAVYYCAELAEKSLNCRKPSTFMAQKAVIEYPDIDFTRSLMLGDTESDMRFGRNSGMKTVYINTNRENIAADLYDASFSSLIEFAQSLETSSSQ
jgi:D-glycero-D-manno-heptose 1,7-bisphosphate phosphatase